MTDLRLVADALAALVRDEYPESYSLAEIASTWGDASDEQVRAIEEYEATALRETQERP